MKEKTIIVTILIVMLGFLAFTMNPSAETEHSIDDLTTLNFYKRSNEIDFHSIKKLCSYDYCEYFTGESVKEGLSNFTKNYLRTIKDEETRAILQVQGIRITKIIFNN